MGKNLKSMVSSPLANKLSEGLSFELRTLLNGFQGPIQLLKHRVDDPGLVDIFRLLDTSISRLERFALRSTIASNLNDEQPDFPKTSINLVDIIKFCTLELQPISELENLKITCENQLNPLNIIGNKDLLLHLFEILLEIAISLSRESSTINIRFEENQYIVCSIQAQTAVFPMEMGLGIDECYNHEAITWDFLLAKQIAILHNAQIVVAESHGANNTFHVKFTKEQE